MLFGVSFIYGLVVRWIIMIFLLCLLIMVY